MGYDLVAGDRGSKLIVTCKDNVTKTVINLTGKTVQLRYTIDLGALLVKTMSVPVGTDGKAEYQFAAVDLTAGILTAEVRIQDGASDQLTSLDPFSLAVRAPKS